VERDGSGQCHPDFSKLRVKPKKQLELIGSERARSLPRPGGEELELKPEQGEDL
jgi:hypothetical protein